MDYFDQTAEECGKCDLCRKKADHRSDGDLTKETLNFLGDKPLSFLELTHLVKINKVRLKDILQPLLLEGKLKVENEKYTIV